ncbi:MAG: nucleotidyl transferase AbiEii/AbiGii toxin family protein [Candidatus Omnitrophica bacterium]|nr:nucleotidyl transferase AbiEii/AbiGii toxin family protein [Candidatus Omnitrophota bacterium]
MKKIEKYQQEVLTALSGKIGSFYLAGGTALSMFYFHHRLSVDLDFFTSKFVYSDIERIVKYLESALKKKISLKGQALEERTAKMAVYNIHFTPSDAMKIDFVEDTVELLKKTKMVDGVRILSLEDIYLRKIYALAGMIKILDEAGRYQFIGGRADAKDFYDVYFLSHTFIPLSKFVIKHCNRTVMEAIVKWFRTYNRMAMMDGVLMLDTDKAIDCKAMEKHFKKEIDKILEYEIGEL